MRTYQIFKHKYMSPFDKYTRSLMRPRPWSLSWIGLQWNELLLWKKIIAIVIPISLLFSYFPIQAHFSRGLEYLPYAQSLYTKKLLDTNYTRADMLEYIHNDEAIRIAINV